jgi:photosystem II stability/assembly factor-like uncharacterized protein
MLRILDRQSFRARVRRGTARPQWLAAAFALTLLTAVAAIAPAFAQQAQQQSPPQAPRPMGETTDPSLYSAMRWRSIGPFRAGRVAAVAGIPGDPTTYYIGMPGGGIWKTTNAGEIWTPIFDEARVASVGALAIAPSNSNIVFAGTGEQTAGNGVYKSADAGATWTNIGLKDTKFISSIVVDPRNPDIVVVGVLGHPILGVAAANPAKGVFKTTDGGKTWTKALYKDDMAGISDMVADPGNPRVLYAGVWRPRDFRAAGFQASDMKKQDSWIYKSIDEGSTWKPVPEAGLPTEARGRIGLSVAPGDRGRRVFAIMDQGLYRSDDAGETWRQITADPRIVGNLYICHVYSDPRNADVVYIMQTTTYRSTDGGQNFTAYKGAPGGDDYHVLWIDPQNSQRMILGVDQGAIISVDGGKVWSSWYNQPTGQLYHVTTDNQFPYIAYAAQQDSGTVAVPDRSDFGEISFRDWFSTGGFEFCYIAPDPLNPSIIYSGGWYGSVVRFDKVTGQITHVFVRTDKYRTNQMAPLIFSPQDPHTLYFGTQYLMKTVNGGDSWTILSPDLTVKPGATNPTNVPNAGHEPVDFEPDADADADAGEGRDLDDPGDKDYQGPRLGGAISTLAPSPLQASVIWAGTSNGLVQRTQDGGLTWQNVSPQGLSGLSPIVILEASHFDVNSAYAVVDVSHDTNPYIYRTRDAGKTWQKITDGLPAEWLARAVREDPVRRGLLYAGIENGVYVSFDDGDHWQSLQLNFPTSDVRDLAVHGDDLVAATYGRALWVLDDVSPLRQAGPEISKPAGYLLRPQTAIRVRWDNDQETPLPPEVPASPNPPDGAILYYYLKAVPPGPITIEIHDEEGKLVHRFTSEAPAPDTTIKNVPDYWFGPQTALTKDPGLNRFVWDLHYDPPVALQYGYYGNLLDFVEYTLSDHAIPHDTPREQTLGALASPGQYEVSFIGGGVLMKQPLTITLDPRVHVSQADLDGQLDAAKRISAGIKASTDAFHGAAPLRAAIADREKSLGDNPDAKEMIEALKSLDQKAAALQVGNVRAPGFGSVNRDLARLMFMIEVGDAAPSDSAKEALEDSCGALNKSLAGWRQLSGQGFASINSLLDKYKLAPLPAIAPGNSTTDACAP